MTTSRSTPFILFGLRKVIQDQGSTTQVGAERQTYLSVVTRCHLKGK